MALACLDEGEEEGSLSGGEGEGEVGALEGRVERVAGDLWGGGGLRGASKCGGGGRGGRGSRGRDEDVRFGLGLWFSFRKRWLICLGSLLRLQK